MTRAPQLRGDAGGRPARPADQRRSNAEPDGDKHSGHQGDETRAGESIRLRGGLRRLGSGLIVYGVIGLAVAAIGFGALVWVNGRVTSLRNDVAVTLAQRAAAVELASRVLHDAATTAGSFGATLDQSSHAVSSTVETITETRSALTALEAQLRSVSIFGAAPLSSSADAVGRIAVSMEGLDTRVSLIADSLEGDRQALDGNATSLGRLGDATEALAVRLRSGVIEDSLGDLQRLISITLLVFTAWSVLPAIGALVLGVWLRRELGWPRSPSTPG